MGTYRERARKLPLDPFKLQTIITQDESDGTKDRNWLYSSILDKSAFSGCIKTLSNNKSPGPDGIVNELLRMLPTEIQETIHCSKRERKKKKLRRQ
jgi:hypothetical protein